MVAFFYLSIKSIGQGYSQKAEVWARLLILMAAEGVLLAYSMLSLVRQTEMRLAQLELQRVKLRYRETCQRSFLAFVRHMEPAFVQAWFHLKLISEFQKVADGFTKRLLISMPPGHTKSTHARLFLAWFIGKNPTLKNIVTSYSDELASDDNKGVQDYVDSQAFKQIFPDVNIESRNSSEMVIRDHAGVLYSAGIMGGITGKRATGGILIDDPTKNWQEASSATVKTRLEQEYRMSIRSRSKGTTWIIVIMTRWLQDDFAGNRLQDAANDPKADQWVEINFPAVKDDPLADHDPREIGDTLWPAGDYGKEWADTTRATVNEDAWQSQYQQRPTVVGGGIIKTFKLRFWYHPGVEPPPYRLANDKGELVEIQQVSLPGHFGRSLQSWDMTFKKTTSGSFVAGGAWGTLAPERPSASFLLDQLLERTDFDGACAMVQTMTDNWPGIREKWIEDKANGSGIKDHLQKKIPGINTVLPVGDKIERAQTAAVNINAGNIYIPHPSIYPWVKAYISELAAFPKGKNDDQVDQTTQAINIIYGAGTWKIH